MAGFAVCLILALIFFYTGQWGGGDAKMLMGLGALIGLNFHSRIPDLVVFIFNIVFIGAIYGMIWSIVLGIINRKVFIKEFKKKIGTKMMIWIRTVILIVCVLGLISLFLVPLLYKFIIFIFVFLLFFMFYIWIFIKSIEKVSMIKIMPVEKVTEGDWIVDDVVINKKRICGPKDLGISKEQIATLLSLKKKKKISKIKIKVGMPFVPSFLISYLVTIIFGNWLVLLLF